MKHSVCPSIDGGQTATHIAIAISPAVAPRAQGIESSNLIRSGKRSNSPWGDARHRLVSSASLETRLGPRLYLHDEIPRRIA